MWRVVNGQLHEPIFPGRVLRIDPTTPRPSLWLDREGRALAFGSFDTVREAKEAGLSLAEDLKALRKVLSD